jgi:hypothetical protein
MSSPDPKEMHPWDDFYEKNGIARPPVRDWGMPVGEPRPAKTPPTPSARKGKGPEPLRRAAKPNQPKPLNRPKKEITMEELSAMAAVAEKADLDRLAVNRQEVLTWQRQILRLLWVNRVKVLLGICVLLGGITFQRAREPSPWTLRHRELTANSSKLVSFLNGYAEAGGVFTVRPTTAGDQIYPRAVALKGAARQVFELCEPGATFVLSNDPLGESPLPKEDNPLTEFTGPLPVFHAGNFYRWPRHITPESYVIAYTFSKEDENNARLLSVSVALRTLE